MKNKKQKKLPLLHSNPTWHFCSIWYSWPSSFLLETSFDFCNTMFSLVFLLFQLLFLNLLSRFIFFRPSFKYKALFSLRTTIFSHKFESLYLLFSPAYFLNCYPISFLFQFCFFIIQNDDFENVFPSLRVTKKYRVILHHFYSVNHQTWNLHSNRSLLKMLVSMVSSLFDHMMLLCKVSPPVSDYWMPGCI